LVAREAQALGLQVLTVAPLHGPALTPRAHQIRMRHIFAWPSCLAVLRSLRPDIVHTNDFAMLRIWAIPTKLAGARLFVHLRSLYRRSLSVSAGLGLADAIIAVSRYTQESLPPWALAKSSVSYTGFDRQSDLVGPGQRQQLRRSLGLPVDAAIVGVFGNHAVRKRTHILADILMQIATTSDGRPVVGLACGGKAEPYDTLLDEKIRKFDLQQRLLRPGFVRPVEPWMAACDVVIAPAVREPLARNVLEAQCLGVPVLVSSDGGLRELIVDGETGFVCEPDDMAQWVARIRQLLDDQALVARLTTAAYQSVLSLTPERNAANVERVYEKILHPATRPATHNN
jgi:glycosyltransferase involved in cell wall biosynthesis